MRQKKKTYATLFTYIGMTFVVLGLVILIATLAPVIKEELGFTIRKSLLGVPVNSAIIPVNTDFGIVIPKIEANAKVIPNVDPYNSRVYQVALTQGVAHAKGTSVPGKSGNIFLFSHSSVNFYEASRYNSIFYLLTKLESGDEIDLYYLGDKYSYVVTNKKKVAADAIEYLRPLAGQDETLTLMTCWPPGTSYKRLIIVAKRK